MKKWIIGGVALLAMTVATTGCASVESSSSNNDRAAKSDSSAPGSKSEKQKRDKKSCGTKATDDCTPRIGQKGTVRVDALYWQVKSVKTTKRLAT